MLVGFGFKVATVPFHMWAPDVYDGAPSPITAYMAATVKAAAFVAFVRVWLEAFPTSFHTLAAGGQRAGDRHDDHRQRDRHRAEEPQAHARVLEHRARRLSARRASPPARSQGSSAMLFYLFIYTLATFGAFAVVVTLTRDGQDTRDARRPVGTLDACGRGSPCRMAVLMLALLGFPIFGGAGFFAKWYVLQAALQAPVQQTTLAVVLVLTTVVSAGYYLYVVMLMFMRPRPENAPAPEASGGLTRMVLARERRADPDLRIRRRTRSIARRAERPAAHGDRGVDARRLPARPAPPGQIRARRAPADRERPQRVR